MSDAGAEPLSIVVERDVPFPPDKVWRALTQPHLVEEWLMKTDFQPVDGHGFRLEQDWGTVDCRVRTVEPQRTLSYSWDAARLKSVVTWTLTPTREGTRLRMEQVGFSSEQSRYYRGARDGWPNLFDKLQHTLARLA